MGVCILAIDNDLYVCMYVCYVHMYVCYGFQFDTQSIEWYHFQ